MGKSGKEIENRFWEKAAKPFITLDCKLSATATATAAAETIPGLAVSRSVVISYLLVQCSKALCCYLCIFAYWSDGIVN